MCPLCPSLTKSSDATDDDDAGIGLAIRYAIVLVELFLRVILFVGVLELRYFSTYTSNSIERAEGEEANKLSAAAAWIVPRCARLCG